MTFLGLHASDAPALIDAGSGEMTSYRQLIERASEIAHRIGDDKRLVVLLSCNDRFSASVYAATQLAGHAIAMLDGTKPASLHGAMLTEYRPDWVAGPAGTAEALRTLGLTIESVHEVDGAELIEVVSPTSALIHPALAVLLGTSGTTGSRKYVRLSTDNVEANARAIARYIGITPRERPITSLPLHYSFGLSVLNSHWAAGAAVVVSTESVMQRSFWESVASNKCTSLAGVPYTYQMLERVGYRDMDLPLVLTMQQAGGALDRTLTKLYQQHMVGRGGRFFVMYGQTEATARITYVPPERLTDKLGSAGVAIPGGQLRIVSTDSDMTDGPAAGEVVYQGPNVMLGYAEGRDDLTRGDELGGVLRTGDIGYLDAEGFLFLTGRSKRIAKVFGLRVNLDEVELMLRESGPAAVVAGDDVIWGFCAFGTDESMATLHEALSRRLRVHRSALALRHVERIPVSSSGKVDYRQVERWIKS